MAAANDWISSGDRSHPNLQLVDALKEELTYEGHIDDLKRLECTHLNGSRGSIFEDLLFCVRESQRIHDGDRSHPRLVLLDALNLDYDGWEEDLGRALADHKKSQRDSHGFKFRVESMIRKQAMSEGDHSHENLRFLDSLELLFPGWELDYEEAVKDHSRGYSIKHHIFALFEKQRMFDGDRSHPRLLALDSLGLTYPGWQDDVKEAEGMHLRTKISTIFVSSNSTRHSLMFSPASRRHMNQMEARRGCIQSSARYLKPTGPILAPGTIWKRFGPKILWTASVIGPLTIGFTSAHCLKQFIVAIFMKINTC